MVAKHLHRAATDTVGIPLQQSKVNTGKKALLVISVLSLFVYLQTMETWNVAVTSPWSATNTDQMLIGTMYWKAADPTLFSRDYVFQDDRYTSYYTPSFRWLITPLVSRTGDFIRGLAALQGPLLALYLVAAFALFWEVSRSYWVAVICALLSSLPVQAGDYWGVVGLYVMIPRTVALPVVVLAIYLLLRLLNAEDSLKTSTWLWAILGLLIGLVANLHPTTGFAFAIAVGITALASWYRVNQPAFKGVVLLALGIALGSVPIVWNVMSNSRLPSSSPDFQSFASVVLERISTIIPYRSGRISIFSGDLQLTVGLIWLPLTLFLWLRMTRNQRSWWALLFACVQLFYTWLWTNGIDTIWFIVPVSLILWRWWVRDEAREMVLFELMASIIAASFFLPVILRLVWLNLEVWSLTTLVAELTRGTRLLIIVFYLMVARFGAHSIDMRHRWRETQSSLRAIWVGVITIVGLELIIRTALPIARSSRLYLLPTLFSITVGLIAGVFTWLLLEQRLVTNSISRRLTAGLGFVVAALILACPFLIPRELARKAVNRIELPGINAIMLSPKNQDSVPPLIQAAQWARLHTDRDALFLYAPADVGTNLRGSELRFWSQRSISYDWKSLNQIIYSAPSELVSMRLQFQRVVDASRTPDRLIQLARELGVNYIVRDAAMPLNLSVAYRNDGVIVYSVQ